MTYQRYQGSVPTGGYAQHEYDFCVYQNARLIYQSSAVSFKGRKYPSYFQRIVMPTFTGDIARLNTKDYDIRSILREQPLREESVTTTITTTSTPSETTWANCGDLNVARTQSLSVANLNGVARINFA